MWFFLPTCFQFKLSCSIISIEPFSSDNCQTPVQASNENAWTFKMSITGPGRDVAIQGKLNPGKRSAEDGDPSSRPFTMIRQCDTMFEGLEDYKNDMGGNDTQKDESQDTQSFDTLIIFNLKMPPCAFFSRLETRIRLDLLAA